MEPVKVTRKIDWIVQNLTREKLENEDFYLDSEKFKINLGEMSTEWSIQLTTTDSGGTSYMAIYLMKEGTVRYSFGIKLTVKLEDVQKNLVIKSCAIKPGFGYGFSQFIKVDDLFDPVNNYFYLNDTLKMFFKLELSYPYEDPDELDEDMPSPKNNIDHLNNPTYADFTIKTSDGDELQVHRVFMAENSPFFDKMFTVDMQEKKQSSVVFKDISSAVMKKALMFMYSGKADFTDYKLAIDVLKVADRFIIPGLKKICIDELSGYIDDTSLLEIFVTADKFNDKDLEAKCLKYIVDNYEDLGELDWKSLDFSLIKKVMDVLAASKDAELPNLIIVNKL